MRLVTFRSTVVDAARLGVVQGEDIVDVQRLAATRGDALPASMLELIDMGPSGLAALARLLADCRGVWPAGTSVPAANFRSTTSPPVASFRCRILSSTPA